MKMIASTTLLSALTLITGLAVGTPANSATDNWQERRLLHRTEAETNAEQIGRIVIYDRLEEAVVDTALDQHFSRIGSMMFIRMRHPEPAAEKDGTKDEGEFQEGAWEDDDC